MQQQRWQAGLRKFGRAAKAAVPRVEHPLEKIARVFERVLRQWHNSRVRTHCGGLKPGVDVGGGPGDFAAAGLPDFVDLLKQLRKARTAVTIVRREISAAKKRFPFRREKNIQRPAAGTGRGLDEGHVNLVHVRPLFAIHLDADEVLVQKSRNFFILERFAFHDVAPVAGRIADAEKDRPVFNPRLCKRLITPGEPIHGIVRVLEQVRRFFPCEAVGVFVGGGFHATYGNNKRIQSGLKGNIQHPTFNAELPGVSFWIRC